MDRTWIRQVEERLARAGSDFAAIWSAVAGDAADVVEIRHEPALPELDGYRSRADFRRYVEEEARVFPQAFDGFALRLKVERIPAGLAWAPLSLSGRPKGAQRAVDIRFRVELHYEDRRLVRVVGAQAPDLPKEDVVAWLKAVAKVGGFHPPAATQDRPSKPAAV